MPTALTAEYSLRLADLSDAAMLRSVMLEAWSGTVPASSTAYAETQEMIADKLGRGAGVLLFRGRQAIGGGRFLRVPAPSGGSGSWVELQRIGVVRTYRGRGLGAVVVAALEEEARRRGHGGAQLGVRFDRPQLLAFWSALGYLQADDVQLATVNPATPPPAMMRKRFEPSSGDPASLRSDGNQG